MKMIDNNKGAASNLFLHTIPAYPLTPRAAGNRPLAMRNQGKRHRYASSPPPSFPFPSLPSSVPPSPSLLSRAPGRYPLLPLPRMDRPGPASGATPPGQPLPSPSRRAGPGRPGPLLRLQPSPPRRAGPGRPGPLLRLQPSHCAFKPLPLPLPLSIQLWWLRVLGFRLSPLECLSTRSLPPSRSDAPGPACA